MDAVSKATWDGKKIPLEEYDALVPKYDAAGNIVIENGKVVKIPGKKTKMSEQAELIARYRTDNYKITNKKLRAGITDPKKVPSMPALDGAMAPIKDDILVYRVVQEKFGYHNAEIGSTFTDAAYTYTSSDLKVIDAIVNDTHLVTGKPSYLHIKVPKGYDAVNMGMVDYSAAESGWILKGAYYNAPAEIVLPRNTTLKLVGKTQRSDGAWELEMEVVPK